MGELKLLTIGICGLCGLWKAVLKLLKITLLKCSLVGVRALHNSCNPYPAQKKFMLKNCSVFLYFFQMALKTPHNPQMVKNYD